MKKHVRYSACLLMGSLYLVSLSTLAAIVPDRTRVIFYGAEKSVSVTLKNDSQTTPYLAQTWMEDANGQKISSPLTVLPPVQRIEAHENGQVKIQGMPALSTLSQDKETMFYLNVREIPPRSKKPNTLQIALQTRIKVFYRPVSFPKMDPLNPWQFNITLTRQGESYLVNNPTHYYVILSSASRSKGGALATGFEPIILPPGGSQSLKAKAADLGDAPVLLYVNDFGGRMPMYLNCAGTACHVDKEKSLKG